MDIMIEYHNNRYLFFENHLLNIVTGYNHTIKWQLMRSLYRFQEGKQLNTLEEQTYGIDGLTIKIDNKIMTKKNLQLLFMTNSQELNEQLSLKKNTLMFEYMISQMHHISLQKEYEQLLNQILILEDSINQHFNNNHLENISFKLPVITFEDIIKRSEITGHKEQLSLMNANLLLDQYLYLLQCYLDNHDQYTMIILRNESQFLDASNMQYLYDKLRYLSQQFPKFIVLKMHDNETLSTFNCDTEEIIFVGDTIQQLPPIDIIHQTVYMHYPFEFKASEQELLEQLYRILPIINENNFSQTPLDMVLYEVIQRLLK